MHTRYRPGIIGRCGCSEAPQILNAVRLSRLRRLQNLLFQCGLRPSGGRSGYSAHSLISATPSHVRASLTLSKALTCIPRFTATVSPKRPGSSSGSFSAYAKRGERHEGHGHSPCERRTHRRKTAPSGSPSTRLPSNNTLPTLCCTTAPIISRNVLFASASENFPVAVTWRAPDSADICKVMLMDFCGQYTTLFRHTKNVRVMAYIFAPTS